MVASALALSMMNSGRPSDRAGARSDRRSAPAEQLGISRSSFDEGPNGTAFDLDRQCRAWRTRHQVITDVQVSICTARGRAGIDQPGSIWPSVAGQRHEPAKPPTSKLHVLNHDGHCLGSWYRPPSLRVETLISIRFIARRAASPWPARWSSWE